MRVAMQKVAGVSNVRVSLNEGLTVLDLKENNTVTLSELRQVIKNNGFVTKEAQVVARGSVAVTGGQAEFEVSGSKERIVLVPSATNPGAIANVELTGRVDTANLKQIRFEVQSLRKP